jgi:hypothetical protein
MLNWDRPKSLTKRRYKEHKLFINGAWWPFFVHK